MITAQAVKEFQEIYLKEEGVKLSDSEAEEKANLIFDLIADLLSSANLSNNEIS